VFLVKPCPKCGTKLRFPIDKGKIKVKCQCGYSFVADPDDKSLFKNGNFDLKSKRKNFLMQKIKSLDFREFKKFFITSIYDIKYNFQNFALMPGREKRKFLVKFILFVIIMISVVFFIFLLKTSYLK